MDEKMTTFERRQRILTLLDKQSVVKVVTLAEQFDVSEGTVRNDLAALEDEQRLKRVRGGATIVEYTPALITARLDQKAIINVDAKRRIARWAADMVADGDAIAMDASSTVQHMIPYLQQYRRLTIITNGLETATLLAESTPHTIILVGGMIGANPHSVTGLLGAGMLESLHIRIAFVSGVGFTLEQGLTEYDLAEAELKIALVENASQIVALIDSTKFGKVGFAPCLEVGSLTNLVTDSKASSESIHQLQQEGVIVTVCGERTVTSYRSDGGKPAYRIGFANLTETDISFSVEVRKGLERAAELEQIELVLADNKLSGEQALRVAEYLIEKDVDLVIEYQIDAGINSLIMNKFAQVEIPVIAVDIPMVGATFFGADNYRSGHIAGIELGHWIQEHWAGEYDRLIILEEPRVGTLPAARLTGQVDGLQEILGDMDPGKRIYLDSGNTSRISETRTDETLQALPRGYRFAVVCFNDDAAYGALRAARNLGREENIAIVGQGCDRIIRSELRKRTKAIIGSTAFMPDRYGEKLIELAKHILAGRPVPPAVYMEHVFIDAGNVDRYYPVNR
ncbi:MAG: substrate-binding domain-containing protein [Chloroflexi bacterium]|nr:substrate-binding domain-containing protein [Chloroflexota bacterium]